MAELTLEMYEDLYARRAEILDTIEHGSCSTETMQALNNLNAVLGEQEYVQDALVDQWERDLAAGRTPDLNAEVVGG